MAYKILDHRNQPISEYVIQRTAAHILRKPLHEVNEEVILFTTAVENSQPEEDKPKNWIDVAYWTKFRAPNNFSEGLKENILKLSYYFQKHQYTPYSN